MEKIYVLFGEVNKKDKLITCLEAVLVDNVVKLIMPTAIYTTCHVMAKSIEEENGYVVVGTPVDKGPNGEPILKQWSIIGKLTFNHTLGNYTCDVNIPKPRSRTGNPNLPKWYQYNIKSK